MFERAPEKGATAGKLNAFRIMIFDSTHSILYTLILQEC